jgi:hypothetical protein
VSVLDGFHTTWSNAKATFGEGTPQTGEQYDGSAKLSQAQSTLDSAADGRSGFTLAVADSPALVQ